ncbi:MAG: hypothetical protein B6243_03680 [Anaerolineaceae bacterium 4572_5.2]|nr:MAG: hypothetical protein B6243_03680 [Anaerolineaceae bacterium 4572_5.2]
MEWTQATFETLLIWILLFVLVFLYVFLLVKFYRLLLVKGDREHTITLTNRGNLQSFYQLQVEATEPLLSFKFFYDGIPLAGVPEPVLQEVEEGEEAAAPEDEHTPEPPAAQPASGKSKASSPGASVDKTAKKGQAAASKVGLVASFLGALGSLIPGGAGRKLSKQGAAARSVQTGTIKAAQAPKSMKRKTDAVKGSGSKLGMKTSSGGSTTRNGAAAPEIQEGVVAPPPAQKTTSKIEVIEHWLHNCVQTKDVDPGESILLTLRIGSQKKRYPKGSFVYVIHSQQVPLEEVDVEVPLVSTRGTVYFKPISWWRYWLPTLAVLAIVLATLLSFYYYLAVVWH